MIKRLKEFLNPCPTKGHKYKPARKKIRRKSKDYGEVVADFMVDVDVCVKCGDKSAPYNEVKVDWFNSCSMPSDMWEEIKEIGYIEV